MIVTSPSSRFCLWSTLSSHTMLLEGVVSLAKLSYS